MMLIVLLLAAQSFQPPQDPSKAQPGVAQEEPPRLKPPPDEQSTTLTPTILSRSSATISVMTGADLSMLGVRSLTDALRIIPGMEVQKLSASESGVSVRSYGGPGSARQGILALSDGRQVYNEFFGGVWWESLLVSMDEIKAVEVMRGPGSFLYGPNAMHGLINIVTLSPLDYAEGTLANRQVFFSAAAGSYSSNVEAATFVKREGNTALKVTVCHDDIDEFEKGRDTSNKLFATVRFQTKIDESQELEFSGGAGRHKFDVFFPPIFLPPVQLRTATYTTQSEEYFLKANYQLGDGLKVQATWSRFTAFGQPDFTYQPFHLVLDVADVDVQYSFSPVDRNHVTLGTGYRYAGFDTHDDNISDGRHSTGLGWFFVQDELTLLKDLFVTAGARLDAHSVSGQTVAPRIAVVWEFMPPTVIRVGDRSIVEPGQSVRATAGYGYRTPGLRDLWFDMPLQPKDITIPGLVPPGTPPNVTVTGNRELKPEEIRSFELGYWGRPHRQLQAECSLYYNLYDRLFVFGPNAGSTFTDVNASRHNVNHEDGYGIEANVEYQLTGDIYTFANYAYEIRRDRDTHQGIPAGPRNKVNVGMRVINEKSLSGMLWVNFFDAVEFRDKNTGASLGAVPSYALLNAKLWYPIRLGNADGRIFLQGFNLLDNVHREYPEAQEYGLLALAGVEIAW
jgi:iron complex outermembrane receptor protein